MFIIRAETRPDNGRSPHARPFLVILDSIAGKDPKMTFSPPNRRRQLSS